MLVTELVLSTPRLPSNLGLKKGALFVCLKVFCKGTPKPPKKKGIRVLLGILETQNVILASC